MLSVYDLPDGRLTLDVDGDAVAEDFFTVAARDNPNRAFLFVSHLLGKHLPVSPHKMHAVHQQLAQQLYLRTQDAAAPLLFVGMAETATALARGIYDCWLGMQPAQPSLYLATSRYCLSGYERLTFAEAHSHAPSIGLHVPRDPAWQQRFMHAQTLVLLDDELSTGKTFVNLVRTLQAQGLPLKKVVMVALTDFSANHAAEVDAALAPLLVERISLLQGQWHYHANRAPSVSDGWQAQGAQRVTLPTEHDIAARGGTDSPLQFAPAVVETCHELLADSRSVLVLGCGEFMYAPYRLATLAAEQGVTVNFCATTRSPIRLWGAIKHCRTWLDPYGEGVRNFLYNYYRRAYDDVWLVSELPINDRLETAADDLDARLLYLPSAQMLQAQSFYRTSDMRRLLRHVSLQSRDDEHKPA